MISSGVFGREEHGANAWAASGALLARKNAAAMSSIEDPASRRNFVILTTNSGGAGVAHHNTQNSARVKEKALAEDSANP